MNRESTQVGTAVAATAATAAAEDEAVKRHTDCVYFLASPLTCKKGSECEYRHSEEARINPRDCWFWTNSSCLNPKCPFRHPPLDALFGGSSATSGKPSLPLQPTVPGQFYAPNSYGYNTGKQATPCYYFQKGHCMKGDRCLFMHGPQPVDGTTPQPPAPPKAQSITETHNARKELVDPKRNAQLTKLPQASVVKPVQVLPPTKPLAKAEAPVVENGKVAEKVMVARAPFDDEPPRYKQSKVPSVIGGNPMLRPHRSRQTQPLDEHNLRNGKEPDEFLRESSPGFDVLVDNDLQDTDYYQNEDKFGRSIGHDERHLNSQNDFEYVPSAVDYNSIPKYDRATINDPRGYEQYGRVKDQYGREQRQASSERASGGSYLSERRGFARADSPDQFDESDLRHRLSKQRRVGESRSAVSSDRRADAYKRDDRSFRGEDQRYRVHESSRSNRLQGRLSHFGRSSPEGNQNDSYSSREADRRRTWGRTSPGRQVAASQQGRLQDRLKRLQEDDSISEGRSLRGSIFAGEDNANFVPPKSLAELRDSKVSSGGDHRQAMSQELASSRELRNARLGRVGGPQESENSLSFEGPKPLSEILKRKREEKAAAASGNDSALSAVGGINIKEPRPEDETVNEEVEAGEVTDDIGLSEHKESELELQDTAMLGKEDDQELEEYDQQEGEYDYEDVDGAEGEYAEIEEEYAGEEEYAEGEEEYAGAEEENAGAEEENAGAEEENAVVEEENAEAEEEYLDDDEGDDFEKRIGIMLS
ncbi:hypothetical protein Sjap_014609 [Stephania japonica]|uniref:C3H1-type domain-containing protein n=1 Tax=Stephania japonica TaxID=461633 RepID=A0AAP0IHW2_9MAGN